MASDSGTYTPDTIARRNKIAEMLLGESLKQQKVTHWAEGLANMGRAALGGYLGYQANEEQKGNDKASTEALAALLMPGGSSATSPVSAPDAAPPPARVSATQANGDPTVGEAMTGGYGRNVVPTETGGSIPLPPRNPLGAMNPEFRTKFADLRSAAANQGVNFDAPEAGTIGNVRTPEQQAELYAQGRTAPGPVVTGTLNSNHLTGNAMDVVPRGSTPAQIGSVVSALMKTDPRFSGMRSGATFSNINDPLHVELNKPQGTQVASLDPSSGVQPPMQGGPSAMPVVAPQDGPPPQATQPPPVQMAQATPQGAPQTSDIKAKVVQMLNSPNPAVQRMGRTLATGLVQKQFTEDVPTNDMKEYKAAKAQGFTGTLLDYQTKLKEAGKPVTNINQQQESEYNKTTGKQLADANMSIAQSAGQARGKIATLNRLDTMLKDPSMYTGKGGEGILELKRLGKAIGVDVGDVGPAEAVRSISNQFALELRNPAGGAGMPGAMSDKDREFLQSMVPGLGQNPQGNALIIDYMKRVAQRSVDVDKLRQQYVRKKGRLDEGFYTELSDWSEAHPVFSDDDMKKAAPPAAAPAGGASIDDLLRKYGGSK